MTSQPTMATLLPRYDAIVIGAGQAGGPLAGALARAGRRTALVERVHVGGTCINEGCTPTKTMVASARAAYLARRGADYGVHTGPITVDLTTVRQRKRDIVASFRGGSQKRLEQTDGLDLVFGAARFTGPRTIEVRHADGRTARTSADLIFVNTGGRLLGIEGGEMTSALQLAMLGGLPYTALRDAVFAHPTLAESFNNLFTALDAT